MDKRIQDRGHAHWVERGFQSESFQIAQIVVITIQMIREIHNLIQWAGWINL